ncbi:MAG: hypothetical protein FWC41_08365 [Firmicutes bacterium]|nr:hypothetical protein [Bacillota bacterium]
MVKTKKHYVDELELKEELLKSHAQNKLTNNVVNMFSLMVDGATKRFSYKYEEDREDCMQDAMLQITMKWKCFDMEKDKPFSYFATMIHYALSGQFKKLQTKGFSKIENDNVEVEKIDEYGNKTIRIKKNKRVPQTINIDNNISDLI